MMAEYYDFSMDSTFRAIGQSPTQNAPVSEIRRDCNLPGEIRGQSVRSRLGQLPGPTLQTPFETDRVQSVGISEGLSRVSWKLSRTVLRGGAASNGGSLLDKKTDTGKQPYAIALADRGIMALAGLWENWNSPAGEWLRSFAIVTTQPNELCAELITGCR